MGVLAYFFYMTILKEKLFPVLVIWSLSTLSVAIELTIVTPEGRNYLLDGFATHEEFFTNLQTLVGNKVKAATHSMIAHSKVEIDQLLLNIDAREYTFLQILHSLATSDISFTNQLLELYPHSMLNQVPDLRNFALPIISESLKSNMDYPPKFMYAVTKSIVNTEETGHSFPHLIISEILSLMDKSSVFMEASRLGDIDVMKWLLRSDTNLDLSTALDMAWRRGRKDIVTLLVARNATVEKAETVNATNCNNETLLHVAAVSHTPHFAKDLISLGADVNVLDASGSTPLYLAVGNNDSITAQLLVDSGSDVNLETVAGDIALHEASKNGNVEIAEALIQSGSSIERKNIYGLNPLMISEKYVITGTIQYLLRNKFIADNVELGSLYLMECEKNSKDLKSILRNSELAKRMLILIGLKGSKIEGRIKSKLLNVTLNNLIGPLVQSLINLGARINANDKHTRSIFLKAIHKGNKEIVSLLLDEGVSANTKTSNGTTALHVAASGGNIEIFHLLLERGADIDNAVTHNGWTLLHAASEGGDVQIVKYLLSRGCKINATNSDNYTPLYAAASAGRYLVIRELVEHGSDVARRGALSPLHAAVVAGSVESVNYLIDHGANIDEETNLKDTPLVLAVKRGKEGVAEALLEKGAKLDARDALGRTPLEAAVETNSPKLIELLLERGVKQIKKPVGYGSGGRVDHATFLKNEAGKRAEVMLDVRSKVNMWSYKK